MPCCPSLALLSIRRALNIAYRRVGGIRFLKVGRLTVSCSISRTYRPMGG